jgi:ribose 5-phosphate isomerase A
MAHEEQKMAAARASLEYIHDGMLVGLGTGSTSECFIRLLGERVKAGLNIRGLPSSIRVRQLAEELAIPLTSFEEVQELDVYVDGADEIDPQLRLIKGGGGALLREKVVASASRLFIVIGDSSKQVRMLGKFPLPVEVVPFARELIARRIADLGAKVSLRKYAYGNPFTTDEGHQILDCQFGKIPDPPALANVLSNMPGVMEHGLFIDIADVALIGTDKGVIQRKGWAGK